MSIIRRNIRFTPPPAAAVTPGQEGVLLLDDDMRILTLVTGALTPVLGGLALLKAQTIKEALKLAAAHPIRLFILDVELPDGTGLDFHRQVRERHRSAHTIVITGTPLIVDDHFSERFGTAHVLRKPFDIVELQSTVKTLLSHPVLPAPAPAGLADTFAATLHSLTPTDIIQLKCIGKGTTALRFSSTDAKTGVIHFDNGDIVHAETAASIGVAAFNEIVTWRGGNVSELPAIPVKRTIQGTWEGLLMDALRIADEASVPL